MAPGFAFACAMRSFTDFTGNAGETCAMKVCDATFVIGTKSRSTLNGSFAPWIAGLTVRFAPEATSSV